MGRNVSGISQKWDLRYLDLAKHISTWSKDPSTKIGSVAIGKNGQVLSQGYNGFLPSSKHVSRIRDNHEQSTVHAEQNAISYAAKCGVSVNKCTAYITHYPCIICTRLLLAAGIESIKYLHDYKNDPLVVVFTNQLNVDVEKMPI